MINRKSYRELFKNLCFSRVQTLFKTFSLFIRSIKASNQYFCCFPPNLLQGFCPRTLVRPVYPSFFHLFSFFMHLRAIFEPMKIGVFDNFFQNWSLGFCCGMIYNWSMWINLINLLICEKLEFLGLETTRIGDFVQLGLIWWNWLVGLIHMIIILCFLSWLMINWSISWKLYKWFFNFFGFLT